MGIEKGDAFGMWTVLEALVIVPRSNGYARKMAKCVCACGHEKLVPQIDLRDGSSKSCRRHGGRHLGQANVL